ncbi:MAG: T9SS type A sorting domain-containing protein [Flavobacteriia bacterium]|nr:T9SS type A sorting domain-containing protein [Flavobacteriia bacterium]
MKNLSLLLLFFCSQMNFAQGVQIVGPDTLCTAGPCTGTSYFLRLPPNCTVTWRTNSVIPTGVSIAPTSQGVVVSSDRTIRSAVNISLCATIQCDSISRQTCKSIYVPAIDSALLPPWRAFTWKLRGYPAQREIDIICYSNVRVPHAHVNTWKLYKVSQVNGQWIRSNRVLQTSNGPDSACFYRIPSDFYMVEQHVQMVGSISFMYHKIFQDGAGLKTHLATNQNVESQNTILPNPATSWITIPSLTEPALIEIYSLDGRLLKSGNVTIAEQRIDISTIPPQMCIVRVSTTTSSTSMRLLIE